jgi:hypothetical protein
MTTPSSTVPESSGPEPTSHRNHPDPDRPISWLGPLLRRLHFYAGILIGPFILIAALTGAAYAISPTLEKLVYADQLSVPATDDPLPLAAQIDAANTVIAGSDSTLSALRPAPEPGDTTRVMYDDPSLGESESRAIFVDPATAEVVGDLTVYGTSGALPLRTWIDQMHRSLHLGDVGRIYSELAASWLGIVAAAGLVLWILRLAKPRSRRDAATEPEAQGAETHVLLARLGWCLGGDRHALPLGHRDHVVAVRRRERDETACRAELGDSGRVDGTRQRGRRAC